MGYTMNHGSLFSGIGGFDLAAQWMGWNNVFHCEKDPFCNRILKYYWPNAKNHEDIKETDFTGYKSTIDILTGGFPCQPFSLSGVRKGITDDRYLWPEMLRAIGEIAPRWIVGENVYGIVNWGGGVVFNKIQIDLEDQGYEVQPYILPACGKNAPHKRERVWFIANSFSKRRCSGDIGRKDAIYVDPRSEGTGSGGVFERFPTQPPLCGGNDGISNKLDGITFPNWRSKSNNSYGNAIVPQVAFSIFNAIEKYDRLSLMS